MIYTRQELLALAALLTTALFIGWLPYSVRAAYLRIGRIELAAMALSMLFWVPYFVFRLS